MALIEWNETMSVAVAEMDSEHKELVRLINQLHDAVASHQDEDSLWKTFDMLARYTVYHFSGEEQLMRDVGYPHLEHHVQQHQALLGEVQALKEQYEIGGRGSVSKEVLTFLKRWLLTHICISDRLYGRFIAKQEESRVQPSDDAGPRD